MAKADRLSAIAFFALGLALLVGGWTMDRLEIRQIHPASIPGLMPMILGVLLALCAVLLMVSSFSSTPEDPADEPFAGGSWTRLALSAVTCCVYALGLIGTLSYMLATFLFTAVFTLIFSFPLEGDTRARMVAVGGALALAIFVSVGSAVMFRELFLVRLP